MKAQLRIEHDTHNSFTDEMYLGVQVVPGQEYVWITLEDREVAVNVAELIHILKFVE